MQNAFTNYLKPLVAITLLALAIVFVMTSYVMQQPEWLKAFLIIPVFYFFLYAAFHYGAIQNTDGKAFVRYYMVASFLKLLILVTIIIAYALFNKEGARAFAINFLISYFVFMVFEVLHLRKHFGNK